EGMRNAVFSVLVLVCLIAGAAAPAQDKQPGTKPAPKFTVAKDTTYVLGPLTKDGFPDYVTALNERLAKGVTPANNAAVLWCQAIGPRPEGAPLPDKCYKWLGIKAPPDKGSYFVSFGRYLTAELQLMPGPATTELLDEFDLAGARAWKAKEYPIVAGWLKA